MALFGNKEEKAAEEQAAKAEAERLQSMSAVELAEVLMPAFGSKYLKDLREPIMEGLQDLENAGLIVGRTRGGAASLLKATRLGEDALAEGTVADHLR